MVTDEVWFEANGNWIGPVVIDAQSAAEFNALVAPLEAKDGHVLNGPGRRRCLRAFRESPDGFRRLVDVATVKGTRSKRGLLIYMVESGEHHLSDSPVAA